MSKFSNKTFYKIVELGKKGEFLTLFHGIGGYQGITHRQNY